MKREVLLVLVIAGALLLVDAHLASADQRFWVRKVIPAEIDGDPEEPDSTDRGLLSGLFEGAPNPRASDQLANGVPDSAMEGRTGLAQRRHLVGLLNVAIRSASWILRW